MMFVRRGYFWSYFLLLAHRQKFLAEIKIIAKKQDEEQREIILNSSPPLQSESLWPSFYLLFFSFLQSAEMKISFKI